MLTGLIKKLCTLQGLTFEKNSFKEGWIQEAEKQQTWYKGKAKAGMGRLHKGRHNKMGRVHYG